MILGESNLSDRNLANKIQLGWWLVSIRDSPLQLIELGILWISDQGGSILRYNFDFRSQSSSTCRTLILLEFLTYWSMISRLDYCDTLLVMIIMPKRLNVVD